MKRQTKQAAALETKRELNMLLLAELRAGYKQATEHPIPVLAQDLALRVMGLIGTRGGPIELEVLNQLGWSLNSVGANFAEGCGRFSAADKQRFMRTARGSMYESIIHAKLLRVDFLDTVYTLSGMLDEYIIGMITQGGDLTAEIEE